MELQSWWYFFPVTGLNIIDRKPSLDKPLFKDATLISKVSLRSLIKENKRITPIEGKNIEKIIASDEVNCFIAINIKLDEFDPNKVIDGVARRHLAIISALTIFTLVQSNYYKACRPTNTYSYTGLKTLALCENYSYWNAKFLRNQLIEFLPCYDEKYTIAKLRAAIKKSQLRKTLTIILQNDKNIHNSIKTAITSAVEHFANALYTNLAGEIIAATITCFEILLKINMAKDDDVRARLDVIAGLNKKRIANLYAARNKWVHQGIIPDKKLAHNTIYDFTIILEYFTDIVFKVPSLTEHEAILQWIDYHAFIRSKYKEMPGKLKSICTKLKKLDPFEIVENINQQQQ